MIGRRSFTRTAVALAALPVAACQRRVTVPSLVAYARPVDGFGAMLLVGTLGPVARENALVTMERLIYEDARTIRIAILSGDGDLGSARAVGDFMADASANRGITFETYNIAVVGSPATYVFLSAQRRYARPGSVFLFTVPPTPVTSEFPTQQQRNRIVGIEAYQAGLRTLFRARTRLAPDAIDVYLRRTVVVTADEARRDGVVDALRDLPAGLGLPLLPRTAPPGRS